MSNDPMMTALTAPDAGSALDTLNTSTPDVSQGEPTPAVETTPSTPAGEREGAKPEAPATEGEPKEDLGEFTGQVSARLRSLAKDSPEFAAALQKDANLKNTIEATFRRDSAYRELFPTVAEARALREALPNGVRDLDELTATVREVNELDKDVAQRSEDGTYPGHRKILRDIWTESPEAAGNLMAEGMKSWPTYDKEGYDRYFSSVMGATFAADRIPQFLQTLHSVSDGLKNPQLDALVNELEQYINPFIQGSKPSEPSVEQRQIQADRAKLQEEQKASTQQKKTEFHQSVVGESRKLCRSIIEDHPLIKRLPPTVSANDKARIVEKIFGRIHENLTANTSFRSKWESRYNGMDMKGALELQRASWSQPWLLNRFVRLVLGEEAANLAKGQPAARQNAVQTRPGQPQNRGATTHTRPYQENGRWFKPTGRPFSTEEILSGKHLE